jgi:hypothetical protein
MPGKLAQPVPARRSKVVRMNPAGSSGGGGSREFHSLKMRLFRYRNKNGS